MASYRPKPGVSPVQLVVNSHVIPGKTPANLSLKITTPTCLPNMLLTTNGPVGLNKVLPLFSIFTLKITSGLL